MNFIAGLAIGFILGVFMLMLVAVLAADGWDKRDKDK